MAKPRVFKIESMWVLEWPAFGFCPEPVLIGYETWAEAMIASGRQLIAGRDGGYSIADRPLLMSESDRWSL